MSAPSNAVKGSKVETYFKAENVAKVAGLLKKYRPDLIPAALARASYIVASQGTPKEIRPKKKRGVSKK
jgi:hypothetical protein